MTGLCGRDHASAPGPSTSCHCPKIAGSFWPHLFVSLPDTTPHPPSQAHCLRRSHPSSGYRPRSSGCSSWKKLPPRLLGNEPSHHAAPALLCTQGWLHHPHATAQVAPLHPGQVGLRGLLQARQKSLSRLYFAHPILYIYSATCIFC